MSIKKSIVVRSRIVFIALVLFALAVVARIFIIQYVQGDKWRAMAAQNNMKYQVVKASRGNIYSDNGSLLATTIPSYRLILDPLEIDKDILDKDLDSLCLLLSKHFMDRSAKEYKRRILNARADSSHYLVINKKIDFQTKKMMATWPIFRSGRMKGGVIFERSVERLYPFGYLAKRTVGFINESNQGAGLEYSFNKYLAGKNGEALFRRIAGGNWMPVGDESDADVAAEDGLDIQTTIDINLQDVAESSLLNHLKFHDADYGCVIMMEVSTGEIKAIANLGRIGPGVYMENYNYAIGDQGLTEPGSTFKLASMMALFEMTDVRPEDSVDAHNGKYTFFDRTMTDSKPGGYKTLTVQQAFEKSSNIVVSKLVYEHFGVEPKRYVDFIRNLGIGEQLGFQMEGEGKPYIKDPSDPSWSGISLPWMSIGYEMRVTPIHTLALYNAIANDGNMIRPIIVKEVRVADQVVEKYETKVLHKQICSDETLMMVRGMLEGVVEHGTASNINNTTYKIAGKTGTAQRIVNGKYTKTYYTSFCGYFPADRPKYSCIVVIDNPKGFNLYGSDVAAPVFKEVADKIYAQDLELHEPLVLNPNPIVIGLPVLRTGLYDDMRYICDELGVANHMQDDAEDWVYATVNNKSINWNNRRLVDGLVPDVSGMTLRDALYVLENRGLRVRYAGYGRVSSQSVAPGTTIVKGNQIVLNLN